MNGFITVNEDGSWTRYGVDGEQVAVGLATRMTKAPVVDKKHSVCTFPAYDSEMKEKWRHQHKR